MIQEDEMDHDTAAQIRALQSKPVFYGRTAWGPIRSRTERVAQASRGLANRILRRLSRA
jgi:hypothetical protein